MKLFHPTFRTMKLNFPMEQIGKLFLVGFILVLNACSGPVPPPTQTPVASSTPTPTTTIIWFPATDTPSLLPTSPATPTVDIHPGLSDQIFSDTFNQPELWDTSTSEQASALITNNKLVMTVNGPGPLSIYSLRKQPILEDFYAETLIDISICAAKDQFGVVFRASSAKDFYRLTLNCSGQLRMDRVRGGETYPLNDFISSGDAPSGAPAQVKIGIWANAREMRVFLNDNYQFSVLDPVFTSGTIGFYVYANGKTPVTVTFSNLAIYSVSYVPPMPSNTPSFTSSPSPKP